MKFRSSAKKDPEHAAAQVKEYLVSLPPDARKIINEMREAILDAAPRSLEGFSYGFPVFTLDGEPVVWCAAWKHHTSIYPITAVVKNALETELEGYDISKGTIRFPLTQPPPAALVKRLVKARVAELRSKGEG